MTSSVVPCEREGSARDRVHGRYMHGMYPISQPRRLGYTNVRDGQVVKRGETAGLPCQGCVENDGMRCASPSMAQREQEEAT